MSKRAPLCLEWNCIKKTVSHASHTDNWSLDAEYNRARKSLTKKAYDLGVMLGFAKYSNSKSQSEKNKERLKLVEKRLESLENDATREHTKFVNKIKNKAKGDYQKYLMGTSRYKTNELLTEVRRESFKAEGQIAELLSGLR